MNNEIKPISDTEFELIVLEIEKNKKLLEQDLETLNDLTKIIKERRCKIKELEKTIYSIVKKETYYILENKKIPSHLLTDINSKVKKETTEEMIPILRKNITEINLPTRACNCLISRNILFVYQLIQLSEHELLTTKNLFAKTYHQIKDCLEALGLELGMILTDDIKEKLLNK